LKEDRPDVVLTPLWSQALEAMAELGLRAPQEICLAVLGVPSCESELGGVTENGELMGAIGVDHLSGMLQRGEYGLLRRPIRLTVEGDYVAGKTLKPRAELVLAPNR
jgi:hypothetical protein